MDKVSRRFEPILVAEDCLDDAMILRVAFQRARILNPLQVVEDGARALEYVRGEGAFSDRKQHPYPLLFLLDLKMPRKGGMDVLRSLRDHPPEPALPVVVTAGASEMREVNCAYSLGARSFLTKPLTWLDVMELLSCFRELRLAAQGDQYALERVHAAPPKPLVLKPALYQYKPQPLDTSRLKLTEDILRLTELLAENNHEVWARDRMQQGWIFGPTRDDQKKEHPCLVPYRELPESEKVVDRNVALETIKTIFSFGLPYPVLENATNSVRTDVISQTTATLCKSDFRPDDLRTLWDAHNAVVWAQDIELYRKAMAVALDFGEAFLALEIAAEGLKKYHGDVHLRQMQAVALARTGAMLVARDVIEQLRSSGEQDNTTLSLLARTYKDLWALGDDGKRRHLKMSFELYSEAYRKKPTWRSGINAAATGLLYGEQEIAFQTAKEVEQQCHAALHVIDQKSDECYLAQLALAESLLIQGDLQRAGEHYRQAGKAAGQTWRILNRARAQARLLLERIGRPRNELDNCFNLPRIVVCHGQMFDKPESRQMRFPLGLEARVREKIGQKLAEIGALIGFSSLSSGAEILFAEAILERGGEINVTLPCNRQEFKRANVEIVPGARLGERFDQILARASSVTILDEEFPTGAPGLDDFHQHLTIGKALLQGRMLDLDVATLTIGDAPALESFAASDAVAKGRQLAAEVIRLDRMLEEVTSQDALVRQRLQRIPRFPDFTPEKPEPAPQMIKAVLLADITGHGSLSPQQLPIFIQHFLSGVSQLLDAMPKKPVVRNTWGDTIHVVFDDVADAGLFALTLQDFMREADWREVGLPHSLNIRVTLHAGPVYPCMDPISGKTTFLGAHVNRTARIEPIAEEGQIYATEAFAALSTCSGTHHYVCDYIGEKQMPKRYGAMPVFIVRRHALSL